MPRAFLIKKHYSPSSSSARLSASAASKRRFSVIEEEEEEDVTDYEPKDYTSKKQSLASDSGSEFSSSPINSPSPRPSADLSLPQHQQLPPHPLPQPSHYLYYRHPLIKDDTPTAATALIARSSLDIYGRPPVLEPLNINASTANVPIWVKPFLPSSYLPFSTFSHHQPSSTALGGGGGLIRRSVYGYPEEAFFQQQRLQRSSSHSLSPSTPRSVDDEEECLDLAFSNRYSPSNFSSQLRDDRPSSNKLELHCPSKEKIKNGAGMNTILPDEVEEEDDDEEEEEEDEDGGVVVVVDDVYCKKNKMGSPSSPTLDAQQQQQQQLPLLPPAPSVVVSSGRRRSNDGARYHCPDCQKSYSTFSGLSKHQQFHCSTNNKRSFSCKYCEKVYVSLGALKMHIRTHTLPCKCKLCGKAFSRPWLLQGHIRTHTGEKPFSCPHCNRAFADRSNLRAHLQTHSDVKKYSCKNCAKTFSRMSLLLKHEDSGCGTSSVVQVDRLGP